MKNTAIAFAAFSILGLAACNMLSNKTPRIKKITSLRGITTEYTYDNDGNILSTKNSDGVNSTYKYNSKAIVESISDSVRHLSMNSTITLDSKGLADSSIATEAGETFIKTYAHDGDGHLIESKDYTNGQMNSDAKSTFKDGNQVAVAVFDSASKPMVNVYLDYYTDKPNTAGFNNYGMKFLGSDSKNLIKKFVQVLPSGDTFRVNNFTYKFDDKGRVTEKSVHDARGMLMDSSSYSYF